MSRFACAFIVVVSLLSAACATQPASAKRDPRDPFERINRKTDAFNDAIDRAVLKPVARGYRKVTPQVIETGVSNFMDNISYPTTLVNDLLQGKFRATLHDTGRLLLNSTIGIGGLFDPASAAGLDRNDEDFGQTLGKWGLGSGAYLVVPFVGPSTVRDAFAQIPDEFSDGRHYIERDKIRYSIRALGLIDTRARLFEVEGALDQAFDRYAFIRNAYLQRREYQVTDGEVPEEPLDEEPLEDPEPEADASR